MCSKTLAWYRTDTIGLPSGSAALNASNVELVTTLLVKCIPSNNCLGEERTFKIVSPALKIVMLLKMGIKCTILIGVSKVYGPIY